MKRNKFIKNYNTTKNKELPNMEITKKLSITTTITMNKSNNFKGFQIIKHNKKSCLCQNFSSLNQQ